MKSREEEVKNLLDSEVSDKSEEVERQQLEQLKEIELLKTGNCLKLKVYSSECFVISKLTRAGSNGWTMKTSVALPDFEIANSLYCVYT